MMDLEDFLMGSLGCMLAVMCIGLTIGAVAVGVDVVQGRRAFVAMTACEAKQALPRRQFLSTRVLCVPSIRRQDTTTINLKTP